MNISDDDRDIDVESDVSVVISFNKLRKVRSLYLFNFFFKEGDDSDSRQPTPRQSNTQYYSQVKRLH